MSVENVAQSVILTSAVLTPQLRRSELSCVVTINEASCDRLKCTFAIIVLTATDN